MRVRRFFKLKLIPMRANIPFMPGTIRRQFDVQKLFLLEHARLKK
jgi:hypothetical protein